MNELVYFSTRIPKDLKIAIKIKSVQEGKSVQEITILALQEWLKQNEKDGK